MCRARDDESGGCERDPHAPVPSAARSDDLVDHEEHDERREENQVIAAGPVLHQQRERSAGEGCEPRPG